MAVFELKLSDPWFTLVDLGIKTVEGRLNRGKFKSIEVGDIISWSNDDFWPRKCVSKVTAKRYYKSFEEMTEKEGIHKVLPSLIHKYHVESVYRKYYTEDEEHAFGVVALELNFI